MGNHHIVCKKYVGYVNAARRCRRYIMRQHHAMRQLTASGELRAATAARVARVASSGINVYGHSYHSGERRNQHLRPQLPQRPERRATESIATSSSERRNKCLRPAASVERRAASGERREYTALTTIAPASTMDLYSEATRYCYGIPKYILIGLISSSSILAKIE